MGFWDEVPDVGLVPRGHYKLAIEKMEKVFSQNGGKYMVKATFRVEEPTEFKGSFIFENYVLGTDAVPGTPDSSTVGSKLLKSCLVSAGVPFQADFDATWLSAKGGLFVGKIDIEEGTGGYQDKNRLKACLTLAKGLAKIGTEGAAGPSGPSGSPGTPPVQPGTGGGGPSPVGQPVGMPITKEPPSAAGGPVEGGMPLQRAEDGVMVPAHIQVRYNAAYLNNDPGAMAEILAGG